MAENVIRSECTLQTIHADSFFKSVVWLWFAFAPTRSVMISNLLERAFYDERSVFMRGNWVQSCFHIRGGITVEKTVQSIYFDSRRLVRFFLGCPIVLLLDRVFSIHIEVFHDHWSETTMKVFNKYSWDFSIVSASSSTENLLKCTFADHHRRVSVGCYFPRGFIADRRPRTKRWT